MKIKTFNTFKTNESISNEEKEILNSHKDYAIDVLRSMFRRIKGYNISTEEFNEILDKKIKELKSEKFNIDESILNESIIHELDLGPNPEADDISEIVDKVNEIIETINSMQNIK